VAHPLQPYAVLDYCKRLGVKLEPFIQKNHNAYLHRSDAFDGKPQRFRHIATDYRGHVAELLAKATDQGLLDAVVTNADKAKLLDSLRAYGCRGRLRATYTLRSHHTGRWFAVKARPVSGRSARPDVGGHSCGSRRFRRVSGVVQSRPSLALL
jgi:monoamine oxidase